MSENNEITDLGSDYKNIKHLPSRTVVKCRGRPWAEAPREDCDAEGIAFPVNTLPHGIYPELGEALSLFENLEILSCLGCGIDELRHLDELQSLKEINFHQTYIDEIKGIDALHNLELVKIFDSPVAETYGGLRSGMDNYIVGSEWEENWSELAEQYPGVEFRFNLQSPFISPYRDRFSPEFLEKTARWTRTYRTRDFTERSRPQPEDVITDDYRLLNDEFIDIVHSVKCARGEWKQFDNIPNNCIVEGLKIHRDADPIQSIGDWKLDRFGNLKELYTDGIGIGSLNGIERIENMLKLKSIGENYDEIPDLSALENLKHLNLDRSNISQVGNGTRNLMRLTEISLRDTPASIKYGMMHSDSDWIQGSPWQAVWTSLRNRYPRTKFDFIPDIACRGDESAVRNNYPDFPFNTYKGMCNVVETRKQADRRIEELRNRDVSSETIASTIDDTNVRIENMITSMIAMADTDDIIMSGIRLGVAGEETEPTHYEEMHDTECNYLKQRATELGCDFIG